MPSLRLMTKFLQMVLLIPDSEEIIKNLLKLRGRKVSTRKEKIKYHLNERGKIAFVHQKVKRYHTRVFPVKRKKQPLVKEHLQIAQKKKVKLKLVPKTKVKQ